MPTEAAWNGRPAKLGWHWLIRQRDGQPRMAYYDRVGAGWRVADAIGRTVVLSESKVAKLYVYGEPVPEPIEDRLRCAICGFLIDNRYEAEKPTIDFTMAGRAKTGAAPRRPHLTMTSEEYAATPIIGWHEVCRDVDGFGGVGIRYLGTDGT